MGNKKVENRKIIGRIDLPTTDVAGVVLYDDAVIHSSMTVMELQVLQEEIEKVKEKMKEIEGRNDFPIFTLQAMELAYPIIGQHASAIKMLEVGKSTEILVDAGCAIEIHRVSEHFIYGLWVQILVQVIETVETNKVVQKQPEHKKKLLNL